MKIHVTPNMSSLPIILAFYKGFYSELGLRIQISQVAHYPQIEHLLETDYCEAGELSYSSLLYRSVQHSDLEQLGIYPGMILSYQKPAIYSQYDLDSGYYDWNQSQLIQYFLPVPSKYSLERFYSLRMVNTFFSANPGLVSFPTLPAHLIENIFFTKDCFGIVGDLGVYPFLIQNIRAYFKSSKYYPNTVIAFKRSFIEENSSDVASFLSAVNKAKKFISNITFSELLEIFQSAIKDKFFTVFRQSDLLKALPEIYNGFKEMFDLEIQIEKFHALSELITVKQSEKTRYKSRNSEFIDLMQRVQNGEQLFHLNLVEKKEFEEQEKGQFAQNLLVGNSNFNKNIYRILFNESSELLFIFNGLDLSIVDANPKFCQETGYSLSELEDITLSSLILDYTPSHPICKFLEHPEDSRYIPNVTLNHRSGIKLSFDMFFNYIEGNENKKFLTLLINNTEKKETMRLKHEFISNISHELRTPMTNIQGYMDILLADVTINFTQEHRDILNVIVKNITRMIKLINNLLQIGKSNAGQKDELELFDPKFIIQETVDINQKIALEKNLKVILELENGIFLEGSKLDFSQVIANLFVNALKYTEKGGVTITCNRVENNICQIKVSDTGLGIDPQYHLSVFERFFRVPDATNKKIGGTGLGLAIAQETISKMGGIITLDSLPGMGTTFVIMVPYLD